jgi:small subunit ribosomal protein S16
MPVRIRLQRHGKKGKPFYWIVAADARAKRDGKFLEKLGIYNPNTNPATIEINMDQSVQWLDHGAQPSETARRILSYKGVLLKHHLKAGVRKGALTEEQAEAKFEAWVAEKEQKISSKSEGLEKAKAEARAKALEAEKEANEKRAQAAAAEAAEEVAEEAVAEEAVAEEAVAEEAAAEQTPAVEAEAAATEEAPAAEAGEAPAAEEADTEKQ